ncbi:MAG: hypothetical protein H6744_08965 [Deltaproteobacteria bacterium]|nr:hypothetical protein [Deltaproteobacteria bacterium]
MARAGHLAAVAGACALLLLATAAPAQAAAAEPQGPVIAQGQDRVIETILGAGAELPAGCRLAGSEIVRAEVVADYLCQGGRGQRLLLRHPSAATQDARQAGPLALALAPPAAGGPPPLAPADAALLLDAIAARSLRHGAGFRWREPAPSRSAPPPAPSPAPQRPEPLRPRALSPYAAVTFAFAAASVALALAAGLIRRRRRRP